MSERQSRLSPVCEVVSTVSLSTRKEYLLTSLSLPYGNDVVKAWNALESFQSSRVYALWVKPLALGSS